MNNQAPRLKTPDQQPTTNSRKLWTGAVAASAAVALWANGTAGKIFSNEGSKTLGPTQAQLAEMIKLQKTEPIVVDQETAVQGVDAVIREIPGDAKIMEREGLSKVDSAKVAALREFATNQTVDDSGIVHDQDSFVIPDLSKPVSPQVTEIPPKN